MTATITESVDDAEVPDSARNLQAEQPAGGSPESGRLTEATRPVPATRRSSWQVLGQRDFRLFFLGSLISNLGTWLQSTAQVLITYKVTHSVFMVGLIASAQFAGMVVSPWAPVLADRYSPRAVLAGTQCLSALIAGAMAWRYHGGLLGVHSLVVGAFGLGFAFALALPVQTALVTALVPEEDAADAVKMTSVSYNAGRALAPALCLPVIMFVGPAQIFALNAISFVIFVIILWFIPVPRADLNRTAGPADEALPVRPPARVRDGLITALEHRRLLLLLAIVAAVTLADDPILVLSPAVADRLHMPSAWAGYFIAALGWGSVLGSLPPTSARGNSAQHASKGAAISLLVLGASIFVFTIGFWSPATLIAAGVAGAAALYTGTAAQTALLRHRQKTGADVATVASVAALWAIAWAGTKPFASLIDGWLAVQIGTVATCLVLISPAVIIALGELLLPAKVRNLINNHSERISAGMVSRLMSTAFSGPRPESQPMPERNGHAAA
jgi:MFS family permease